MKCMQILIISRNGFIKQGSKALFGLEFNTNIDQVIKALMKKLSRLSFNKAKSLSDNSLNIIMNTFGSLRNQVRDLCMRSNYADRLGK